MTIKDIWVIDKQSNNGKILFRLHDLILLIKERLMGAKVWDELIDIKYFYNDKEGWMAICHFQ